MGNELTDRRPARLGVMYDRDWAPEGLPGFARAADRLGLDELWVVEDLGWTGGVSAAAVALASTAPESRLRVGIGITPAPLRSPALLAMELATLARVYPGRLVAGIGHGVQEWMESVGVRARSPLSLLEETITSVRGLLGGERVETAGREVRIDGLRLTHPVPDAPPELLAGVVSPKSLALSGRVADGTIVVEGNGPDDLGRIWKLIGRQPGEGHSLTVFTFFAVDADPAHARAVAAPVLDAHADAMGVPRDGVAAVLGTPAEAATQIRALWAAGATSVVLRPVAPAAEAEGQLAAVVRELG